MEELWQIELSYACFEVTVTNNEVVDAPPIASWMIGRLWPEICHWVGRKKGDCHLIYRKDTNEINPG